MRVKSLSAHQFRNFSHFQPIEFPEAPLLVVLAPNASGKTNFLESIVVLLRGKSFRSQAEDCVMEGADNFIVRGDVAHAEGDSSIMVSYNLPSRTIRILENNSSVSPVMFFGQYPLVLFLPEDAFLFNRGPAMRRNFINTALAGSRQYLAGVVQYHRALRQRNSALKKTGSPDDLAVWTDLIVEHAKVIWSHRQTFGDYLSSNVPAIYKDLFLEDIDISLQVVPGVAKVESFRELLLQAWKYEKRYGYTMYGPHRDDLVVYVGGKPAHTVMSRGQLRGLVIAMKVASYGYIKKLLGHEPLLLFDEVLSELDPDRQKGLLSHMPSGQAILTCTSIPEEIQKRDNVFVLDVRPLVDSRPI